MGFIRPCGGVVWTNGFYAITFLGPSSAITYSVFPYTFSLLGAGRRPSQGFASVFWFHFWCSESPAGLQSLNSD